MLPQSRLALRQKRRTSPLTRMILPDLLPLQKRVCFWEAQTEDDEENGRASAEPEERTPAVGCGVDETAGEDCCQDVAEGVALLVDSAD